MSQIKKFVISLFVLVVCAFSTSICAQAQIEGLSIIDNTIHASVSTENARLYAASYKEGILHSINFADSDLNGYIELPLESSSIDTLFLWDKDSLAPVSVVYTIKDGKAYVKGTTEAIPPYEAPAYSFNQEDDVMIVSAISKESISGYKAGVEVTYNLTDNITVLGLSDSIGDVVPGCVVFIGTDFSGNCAAIELLTSVGKPFSQETYESHFGVHSASDGSRKYQNIVTEMYSKSGLVLKTHILNENGEKTAYTFASPSTMCYRVGIAMDGETPIISCNGAKISTSPSIFSNTALYHNYLYLRYNTVTQRVVQCVFYCVPKDFNPGKGDGEYSDIFNLKPIVICE